MFWRPKQQPQQMPSAPVDEWKPDWVHDSDPEKTIADALRGYQEQFYEKAKNALNRDAEAAKKIVARANKLVGDSGLGPALAPVLLEHVQHWPSWSTHDNFYEYVRFPTRYIGGSYEQDKECRTKTTNVTFSYRAALYTVKFIDQGMTPWATDDLNWYGTVELLSNDLTLLGLDIRQDVSKGDAARWRWSNVFAFLPGPWMKDLVEIAAHIDGSREREWAENRNKDAIERAAKIKLSE